MLHTYLVITLPTKGFELRDFLVADVMFLSQLEKLLENGGRRG